MSQLTPEQKSAVIAKIGEEVLETQELDALLKEDRQLICYDGFEPSGRIHIAQGLMKAINVNRLTQCNVKCIFYVADWFALLNNKCGGDLEKIKRLGQYFIEVWKATGMRMENVEFVWASDFISERPKYWNRVFDIAKQNSLARIQKCSTAMGRTESDQQPVAQIIYPCMQCADVFELKVDICQLGIDQRKVNMLAREYATKMKVKKPVIISHHMLLGLVGGKMSKSLQNSAIFMDDSPEQVELKIGGADCSMEEENNPVLEYFKYLVFSAREVELNGFCEDILVNGKVYQQYKQLREDFLGKLVSVEELKSRLVHYINKLISPVIEHFKKSEELKDLQKFVIEMRVTR